jgi:hypothetical protein
MTERLDYRRHLRQRLGESHVPPALHDGLTEYFADRRQVGSFLTAVLENNFSEACLRADSYNRLYLAQLAKFLISYCPSYAWGSPTKVAAWLTDPAPVPEVFE